MSNTKVREKNKRSHIPFLVPPLPAHVLDRPEVSGDLKQCLLAENPTTPGTLVISAIQGLGGIGKTILAQALAHDPEVKERFGDGTLWATLGQEPDLLSHLSDWIQELGDYDYKPTTVKAASGHLRSLLHNKAILAWLWNDALLLSSVEIQIGDKIWPSYRIHDLLHNLARHWLTTKQAHGLGLSLEAAHKLRRI